MEDKHDKPIEAPIAPIISKNTNKISNWGSCKGKVDIKTNPKIIISIEIRSIKIWVFWKQKINKAAKSMIMDKPVNFTKIFYSIKNTFLLQRKNY